MVVTELKRGPSSLLATAMLLAIAVMGAITLFPEVAIRERADGHVEQKHGTSAREFLQHRGYEEVWYSAQRETFLLVACDPTTELCACMFVGARGMGDIPLREFRAAMLNGRVELTCYWRPASRMQSLIQRDGYVRVG